MIFIFLCVSEAVPAGPNFEYYLGRILWIGTHRCTHFKGLSLVPQNAIGMKTNSQNA